VLRGGDATEQAFRQTAPRYDYIHLATHGFFSLKRVLDDADEVSPPSVSNPAELGTDAGADLAEIHPGLLSGVAFAGAGKLARSTVEDPTRDDGILTALEVAELDMNRARLVVLSACETGLGKVVNGEGVLGLERAFHVAGASTLVISFWSVGDESTRQLMEQFYDNLWRQKMSKLEALRAAQRSLLDSKISGSDAGSGLERVARSGPRRTPPWVWAGWALSGDWR
jgi:CHAT domain-containing protein